MKRCIILFFILLSFQSINADTSKPGLTFKIENAGLNSSYYVGEMFDTNLLLCNSGEKILYNFSMNASPSEGFRLSLDENFGKDDNITFFLKEFNTPTCIRYPAKLGIVNAGGNDYLKGNFNFNFNNGELLHGFMTSPIPFKIIECESSNCPSIDWIDPKLIIKRLDIIGINKNTSDYYQRSLTPTFIKPSIEFENLTLDIDHFIVEIIDEKNAKVILNFYLNGISDTENLSQNSIFLNYDLNSYEVQNFRINSLTPTKRDFGKFYVCNLNVSDCGMVLPLYSEPQDINLLYLEGEVVDYPLKTNVLHELSFNIKNIGTNNTDFFDFGIFIPVKKTFLTEVKVELNEGFIGNANLTHFTSQNVIFKKATSDLEILNIKPAILKRKIDFKTQGDTLLVKRNNDSNYISSYFFVFDGYALLKINVAFEEEIIEEQPTKKLWYVIGAAIIIILIIIGHLMNLWNFIKEFKEIKMALIGLIKRLKQSLSKIKRKKSNQKPKE